MPQAKATHPTEDCSAPRDRLLPKERARLAHRLTAAEVPEVEISSRANKDRLKIRFPNSWLTRKLRQRSGAKQSTQILSLPRTCPRQRSPSAHAGYCC